MQTPNLTIDPNLKVWVLLPMILAMVLFTTFRSQLTAFLTSSPPKQLSLSQRKQAENLKRTALFKKFFWNLPSQHFKDKQTYLVDALSSGFYLAQKKGGSAAAKSPEQSLEQTTENMMGILRGSFGSMISQFLLMQFIQFFFSGLILMKLPFSLTSTFKQMVQSGVKTDELDVRWVSAVSFYLIANMGLPSVFNILGMNEEQAQVSPAQGQMMMPTLSGSPPQPEKIMEQEAKDIKIISHEWCLTGIEDRVLTMYNYQS